MQAFVELCLVWEFALAESQQTFIYKRLRSPLALYLLTGALLGPNYYQLDNADQLKELKLRAADGILWGDLHLATMPLDEIKKLLDVEYSRTIRCRFRDGVVPVGCVRIFTTNANSLEQFVPHDITLSDF